MHFTYTSIEHIYTVPYIWLERKLGLFCIPTYDEFSKGVHLLWTAPIFHVCVHAIAHLLLLIPFMMNDTLRSHTNNGMLNCIATIALSCVHGEKYGTEKKKI